ncbi:MBOAT family O-acyltransferase [Thalassospira indica]|uniref:Probable alginate O-acetylase AlgI n=1 Tax=Thalassospira indica TaxID=1891279 RepID=A0ABM6XVC2_9PROT|nr:MBOAT family O-acyltransferase [Thalassospira indica]AXO13137.1 MBOAT family protein [Thalassospira indica]OAZ15003.1 hypothetical protein TH15_04215 [Thalassospira profundimaris]
MLFNSYEFIFVFLPVVYVLCNYGINFFPGVAQGTSKGNEIRVKFLFASSLVFYGWWFWKYIFIILASIIINFYVSNRMNRAGSARRNKIYLILGVAFNLSLLGYFKYSYFFVENISEILGKEISFEKVILPIGISFFTFQQIAWLVDRYKGEKGEHSFWRYGLFVTFFPQLIAGPIVHHRQLIPQFEQLADKRTWQNLYLGTSIFALGLFKKVIIADSAALISSPIFDAAAVGYQPDFVQAWVATLGYTLQIYFDFSAYSDMAVGIGLIFGMRLPINFASPYKSTSIIEFWQRWHITLSAFLRDYLYIPLGGNRAGRTRQFGNILLTMALGGFWHGASWNFLLWGVMHGLFIIANHVWRLQVSLILPRWLAFGSTLLVVIVAWVPFRSADIGTTISMYQGMLGMNGASLPIWLSSTMLNDLPFLKFDGLGPINLWVVVTILPVGFIISLLMPNNIDYHRYSPEYSENFENRINIWSVLFVRFCFSISLLKLNDVSEFLYFQF